MSYFKVKVRLKDPVDKKWQKPRLQKKNRQVGAKTQQKGSPNNSRPRLQESSMEQYRFCT